MLTMAKSFPIKKSAIQSELIKDLFVSATLLTVRGF